jgi:hypothetical protein
VRTTVRLYDGREIELTTAQSRRIHDELWELIPDYTRAATAAIKIRLSVDPNRIDLGESETAAFLAARERIAATSRTSFHLRSGE